MSWKYNPFTGEFDYFEDCGNTLFEIDENGDTILANVTLKEMELDSNEDLMLKVEPPGSYCDMYYELDANYDVMPKEV